MVALDNIQSYTSTTLPYGEWEGTNFWADQPLLFSPNVDRAVPFTNLYPRGMHWPWPQVFKDMDRLMVQPTKGVTDVACEDICSGTTDNEEDFLTCLYAKNNKECTTLQALPPLLPQFFLDSK